MRRTDKLAKVYIVPSLKKGGFKKRRLAWNRIRGEFIDVINVQKNRWNEPDDESFTINIGVVVPEFMEIIWDKPYKEFAKHPDGVINFRSGNITQEGFLGWNIPQYPTYEIWWDLRTDEDVEKVGVEVRANIEDKLLPFLDSMSDFRKLHDVLDKSGEADAKRDYPLPKINFALLKNAIGEKEGAIAILKDLIAKDKWTEHAKRALFHVQKGSKETEAI